MAAGSIGHARECARGQGRFWRTLAPGLLVLVAGCNPPGCTQPSDQITGTGDGLDLVPRTQSETIINVSNPLPFVGGPPTQIITVAYNDDFDVAGNPTLIDQTATSRTIFAGASLMGWSWSDDSGSTWHYGGQVKPTPESGAAIIWGDPSITHSLVDPTYVFMGNLMIPTSIYPSGGITGTVLGPRGWRSSIGVN